MRHELVVIFSILGLLMVSWQSLAQDDSLEVEVVAEMPITELETAETVEWSPDGQYLAVGGTGGVLILNNDLQVQAHLVSDLEKYTFATLNWSPDGSRIVATGVQLKVGTITAIINVETGNYLSLSHSIISTPIVWSPSGEQIALGLANQAVNVIDGVTAEILFEYGVEYEPNLAPLGNYPKGLCWVNENQLIAIYGVRFHRLNFLSDTPIEVFLGGDRESNECLIGSNLIVTASGQLLDINTNKWSTLEEDIQGFDVALNPIQSYAAFNVANEQIQIRSIPNLEILATMEGGMGEQNGLIIYYDDSIDWHPDGELLAAVGEDNILRIWRVVEEN